MVNLYEIFYVMKVVGKYGKYVFQRGAGDTKFGNLFFWSYSSIEDDLWWKIWKNVYIFIKISAKSGHHNLSSNPTAKVTEFDNNQ